MEQQFNQIVSFGLTEAKDDENQLVKSYFLGFF